jgi:hypothetical protein
MAPWVEGHVGSLDKTVLANWLPAATAYEMPGVPVPVKSLNIRPGDSFTTATADHWVNRNRVDWKTCTHSEHLVFQRQDARMPHRRAAPCDNYLIQFFGQLADMLAGTV